MPIDAGNGATRIHFVWGWRAEARGTGDLHGAAGVRCNLKPHWLPRAMQPNPHASLLSICRAVSPPELPRARSVAKQRRCSGQSNSPGLLTLRTNGRTQVMGGPRLEP